jgi:BA14K-like protein
MLGYGVSICELSLGRTNKMNFARIMTVAALLAVVVSSASAQVARPQLGQSAAAPANLLTPVRGAGIAIPGEPYYYGPAYNPPYYVDNPAGYYPPPPGNTVAYCARRFKTYDPASGTYLGRGGRRYRCP